MDQSPDVVIIGAGAAGLMAARELSRAGLAVEVVEARTAIGGRVVTESRPGWPFPIELGPEFVHGRVKVTLDLAQELGVELTKLGDMHYTKRAGSLVREERFWDRMARVLSKCDPNAPDESAEAFIAHAGISGDDAAFFRLMVEGFHAAPTGDISIDSIAEDASASGDPADEEQFRVAPGYHVLVERLAASLDPARVCIRTSAPVHSVRWSRGNVEVTTEGTGATVLRAPRALITVSTGVLAGLGLSPDLPEKQGAALSLPLGRVVRVVLLFDGDSWLSAAPAGLEFAHAVGERFPTTWRRSSGSRHQFVVWAGGPKAIALAGKSEAELTSIALGSLCRILGVPEESARRALVGCTHKDFSRDPFIAGAYSYARPGASAARAALATPVEDTLFFAGEATDSHHSGTVAGAFASGVRAAREILGDGGTH